MIEKLPEIQIHSSAKINEKLNEVIDWVNDVSALRVTDKQVTANLPNIDAGELAFLSKENTELKDEIDRSETELKRTRNAALDKLNRIQKIYTNAPFNAPINYAKVCTDMYDVATEQIKELDNE